jgi:glutamate racemase
MAKIIVFDSGIGGLSILKELKKDLQNHHYIYLADQGAFPYGTRSQTWVNNRVVELVLQAVADFKPDLVVLACNSATVSAITHLRQKIKIPLVGVEPVIKPLHNYSAPVLLATKLTLLSSQTKSLLAKSQVPNLLLLEAKGLAEAVENLDFPRAREVLKQLQPKLKNIDALGLSCTHYPLIKDIFLQVFGAKLKLLDPSPAVSRQVTHILQNHPASSPQQCYFTTGDVLRLKEQLSHYLQLDNPLCQTFQLQPK